jgi:hypothetical protein
MAALLAFPAREGSSGHAGHVLRRHAGKLRIYQLMVIGTCPLVAFAALCNRNVTKLQTTEKGRSAPLAC